VSPEKPRFFGARGDGTSPLTDEVCCTDWYDVEVVVSDGCDTSWSFVSVHVDV
jgi:hypothetical protein